MLKEIESNINKNALFTKKDSLLLAISGGIDSVVLAHLLKEAGYSISLAHCNFSLRGKDSERDEKFCRKVAEKLKVKFYSKKIDAKEYSQLHHLSIQMAARELRYKWFKTLMKQEKLDKLVTAHHANDVVETVFINLLRGTGIKGLKGIPVKNENVVRPLLTVSKETIEKYASKEKIKFRTDKSNSEEKFDRNYLRLKVIPALRKINPLIEKTFTKNCRHFSQEAGIVESYLEKKKTELLQNEKDYYFIKINDLQNESYLETFLNYILADFGFNEPQQQSILKAVSGSGNETKHFHSSGFNIHIDKNRMVIVPKNVNAKEEIIINSLEDLTQLFRLSKEKKFHLPKRSELYVSEQKLVFPLMIRTRRTGDKFKPFGMKGYKLISDFFKDEKLSYIEKEKARLLVNGNGQIIWVIGYRSDERYRVDAKEKNLLKLSVAK
jgi:tRNA(Ile)-lysidine synthase